MQDVASDARWFVERFSELLQLKWQNEPVVLAALQHALAGVTREWHIHCNQPVAAHRLPSAGLALVALEGEELVMLRLGDCEVYSLDDCGAKRVFPDSPLLAFDQRAIAAVTERRGQGQPFAEAVGAIHPMLVSHRERLNTPQGYSALSVARIDQMVPEVRRVKACDVSRVLLTSDGFSAAWQGYGLEDPAHWLADERIDERLDDTLRQLRLLEADDPEGDRFPRLKPHDDATAVALDILP
ncbi:hypothetical protein GCM10022228_06940 [Halomonas cibimaris]|uniref:Protein phosphatase 2C domain-containing protein n=1 Tax=Halomonas cibimaris TaxID=657012 RepID=A0ABP7LHI4_9GAMM